MSYSLSYTATTPSDLAGSKSTTLHYWFKDLPQSNAIIVEQIPGCATPGIKYIGGSGSGRMCKAIVRSDAASVAAQRTDIDAWYALYNTTGSVTVIEQDYNETFTNMTLTDIEVPERLNPDYMFITLTFIQSE